MGYWKTDPREFYVQLRGVFRFSSGLLIIAPVRVRYGLRVLSTAQVWYRYNILNLTTLK